MTQMKVSDITGQKLERIDEGFGKWLGQKITSLFPRGPGLAWDQEAIAAGRIDRERAAAEAQAAATVKNKWVSDLKRDVDAAVNSGSVSFTPPSGAPAVREDDESGAYTVAQYVDMWLKGKLEQLGQLSPQYNSAIDKLANEFASKYSGPNGKFPSDVALKMWDLATAARQTQAVATQKAGQARGPKSNTTYEYYGNEYNWNSEKNTWYDESGRPLRDPATINAINTKYWDDQRRNSRSASTAAAPAPAASTTTTAAPAPAASTTTAAPAPAASTTTAAPAPAASTTTAAPAPAASTTTAAPAPAPAARPAARPAAPAAAAPATVAAAAQTPAQIRQQKQAAASQAAQQQMTPKTSPETAPAAPAPTRTGGRIAGQLSQTPSAIRRRQDTANRQQAQQAGAGAFNQMAGQLAGQAPTPGIGGKSGIGKGIVSTKGSPGSQAFGQMAQQLSQKPEATPTKAATPGAQAFGQMAKQLGANARRSPKPAAKSKTTRAAIPPPAKKKSSSKTLH